jgi:hypothetical protein
VAVIFDPDVDVTLEAAFGANPLTASPTWTDISNKLRSFTTSRGRDHLSGDTQTGRASFLLDNNTGNFTPGNTAGAYTPNIRPMTPIRLSATYNLPGGLAVGGTVGGTLDVGVVQLFTGFAEAWTPQWRDAADMTCVLTVSDALKLWNQFDLSGSYGGSCSIAVDGILTSIGWPAAWLDGYQSRVAAAGFSPSGSALAAIRRCSDTDGGYVYTQADGQKMFHPDWYRAGTTVVDTFGDDGAELHYTLDPEWGFDDHQIWNKIRVSRVGVIDSQTASDATSISRYGTRTLTRFDTLHTTDAAAATLASTLLARYKEPHLRLHRISVTPRTDPDLWPAALVYDVGQKMTIKRRPAAGNIINLTCWLEGAAHTVTPKRWESTFTVSQYA